MHAHATRDPLLRSRGPNGTRVRHVSIDGVSVSHLQYQVNSCLQVGAQGDTKKQLPQQPRNCEYCASRVDKKLS